MINRRIISKINKQQRINICFGITLICFIAIMTASFVLNNHKNLNYLAYAEPNEKDPYMMQTDALAKGQVYLDAEPSEELLALENPYAPEQRKGVEYKWDWALYDGKYYSYFGVAPVILFLLPFRLITGMYFSTQYFAFFMSVGAVISLAFCYKILVKKLFENCSPTIITFGLAALLFGSNILLLPARTYFYEIPYGMGLMFTFLSFLMLLKLRPGRPRCVVYAVFAGLFFALSVGCRPNYCIYFILHIPALIYIIRAYLKKKRQLIKMIVAYAVPIVIIGCGIGVFNFLRFDSFFQFGSIYQLTTMDVSKYSLSDFGVINEGMLRYFFQPVVFSSDFPFVFLSNYEFTSAAERMYSCPAFGLICQPVTWNIILFPICTYLSFAKDKSRKRRTIVWVIVSLIISTMFMTVFISAMAGVLKRYMVDLDWLAVGAAVLTFFCFSEQLQSISQSKKTAILNRILRIWFCVSVLISSCICLAIDFMGFPTRKL